MPRDFMKILWYASTQKENKKAYSFPSSYFYWSFLSDFVAVKGLISRSQSGRTNAKGGYLTRMILQSVYVCDAPPPRRPPPFSNSLP